MRMYEKANKLVEQISEILHFLMVYVSAICFIFPKAFLTYFMYYVFGKGPDAFELPFPTW